MSMRLKIGDEVWISLALFSSHGPPRLYMINCFVAVFEASWRPRLACWCLPDSGMHAGRRPSIPSLVDVSFGTFGWHPS